MKQAWGLHKADVLLYLGHHSDAVAVADSALGKTNPTLHDWGFAGAFARWVALTSVGNWRENRGREELEHLIQHLEKFDALDQVEVLCALLLLDWGDVTLFEDLVTNISERLKGLPKASSDQLSRLGVHPACQPFAARQR
jgi:hypothetical protein